MGCRQPPYLSMWKAGVVLVWLLRILTPVSSVDISLNDICGNKLVGSCPKKISLKVIGGESSCAEKVPWNVLIELTSGLMKTLLDPVPQIIWSSHMKIVQGKGALHPVQ